MTFFYLQSAKPPYERNTVLSACARNTRTHSELFDLHAKKMLLILVVFKTTLLVTIKYSIKVSKYPFGEMLGLFVDSDTTFSVR